MFLGQGFTRPRAGSEPLSTEKTYGKYVHQLRIVNHIVEMIRMYTGLNKTLAPVAEESIEQRHVNTLVCIDFGEPLPFTKRDIYAIRIPQTELV